MPDDLETPDNEQPDDSPVIRELRKKAERVDTSEARAIQLERENVVLRAGLNDLTDKQLKALGAAHEGDWEPDALKATAAELGFGKPSEPAEQQKVPQEELDAMQRVQRAAGGETPPPPTELDTALQNAKSPEEIQAILANANMLSIQ